MTDPALLRQQAIENLLSLIRKIAAKDLLAGVADGDSRAMPSDPPKHLVALQALRDRYGWRLACQLKRQMPRETG